MYVTLTYKIELLEIELCVSTKCVYKLCIKYKPDLELNNQQWCHKTKQNQTILTNYFQLSILIIL